MAKHVSDERLTPYFVPQRSKNSLTALKTESQLLTFSTKDAALFIATNPPIQIPRAAQWITSFPKAGHCP